MEPTRKMRKMTIAQTPIKQNVLLVDEFKSPRDQQYARKIKQAVAKK